MRKGHWIQPLVLPDGGLFLANAAPPSEGLGPKPNRLHGVDHLGQKVDKA